MNTNMMLYFVFDSIYLLLLYGVLPFPWTPTGLLSTTYSVTLFIISGLYTGASKKE